MKRFRGIVVFFTQLPLILFVGAKYDLLFGFNRLDAGFATLLFLFVAVPLLNLSWLVVEAARSVRISRRRGRLSSFSVPLAALFFLAESIAIDLYIASHARI